MVIRGGAGITYDYYNLSQSGNARLFALWFHGSAGVAVSVTDPYMGQPAPFPYIKPTAGSDAAKNYVFSGTPIILGYTPDFNAGRTYQMNGTFEWEPVQSWLIRAGYVGSRGTHLNTSYDHNAPVFIAGTDSSGDPLSTNANQQARRPFGAFQRITLTSSDSNSWYNAMQIAVNKRFAHGLALIANYTLSKNTDSGDSVGNYFSSGVNRDPYNRKIDYGLSNYDRPFQVFQPRTCGSCRSLGSHHFLRAKSCMDGLSAEL